MSFALLSTTAAAGLLAVTAAAVTLLYLLRPPPRRLAVSSLLLWRSARRKRSPLERLRWWLSLLLATAVALLLGLALAGLRVGSDGAAILVVVDTAPTMQTRLADGRTRLERAKREAEGLLDRIGSATRVRVADTCGHSEGPGSPGAARRALARLRPCASSEVALPPVRRGERLLLLSDGVSGLAPADDAEVVAVFEPAVNLGVTAFEVARVAGSGSRALIELVNGSSEVQEATLTLQSGGWRAEERVALAAGEAVALIRELPDEVAGVVAAEVVAAGDALADDDRALAWLGEPRWRLRVMGTPGPHLSLALRLDPRVELVGADADAVVAVGVEPPSGIPALVIASEEAAAAEAPALIDDWCRDHPLFRGAPPDDAALHTVLDPPAQALGVVASAGGSPAILSRLGSPRQVRLAFSLDRTGWTRHASFPVFLGNALELLLGPAAIEAGPGEIVVPLPGASVHDPEGIPVHTRSLEGTTRFRADRPGTWLARAGTRAIPVLVSTRDRGVSLVNRSRFRDRTPDPLRLPDTSARPALPPLLVLAAAVLLGFEWWSWRRRITV